MVLATRIVRRFKQELFNVRMFMHQKLGLPAQTNTEIYLIKKIFMGLVQNKNELNIFEWGTGNSTLYYARYLRKNGVKFQWHTIDNSSQWHSMIRKKVSEYNLSESVKMYLKPFKPFWEKPEWGIIPPQCGKFSPKTRNEIEYVNCPIEIKKKFDVIIIDARFRRHCLKAAKRVVSDTGVVIMHDAQKPHYHHGMDDFAYRKFYGTGRWVPFQTNENKTWVGSMSREFQAPILHFRKQPITQILQKIHKFD